MIRVDPSPVLFYFYFLIRSELVRVDPSRSELIRRGLAVRVDPVRLLCMPLLNILFFITSEVNSTMRCCFFIIQTSDRICSFFAIFKPIILQFSQFGKTNCTHSMSRTIQAHASFAQQIIELTTL